jgi:hypothetical protein
MGISFRFYVLGFMAGVDDFYTEFSEFFRINRIFLGMCAWVDGVLITSFASATCFSEAASCYWFFLGCVLGLMRTRRPRSCLCLGCGALVDEFSFF